MCSIHIDKSTTCVNCCTAATASATPMKRRCVRRKTTNTKDVVASAVVNPASTASADADSAPARAKNDNSND
jgi:hypothetical protein